MCESAISDATVDISGTKISMLGTTPNIRWRDNPREYTRQYLVGHNAHRRQDLRRLGLCVDCASPSPFHYRCAECRAIGAAKVRKT